MEINTNTPILVTGATGYCASHLIKILLERGHKVRGTVRSLSNKPKYEFLYRLVPEKNGNLTLVEAELTDKSSWPVAVEGCELIFHVASPLHQAAATQSEAELINQALGGTLNVLEAALEKKAKKVVVTSTCWTMALGNDHKVSTEEDWADESKCFGYPKSKLLAEKAAFEFYEKNKDKIEITVVHPSMVYGPIYTHHKTSTEVLLAGIMEGNHPGIFDTKIITVDVRDVAEGHYQAMFRQGTAGQRYALVGDCASVEDMIIPLKKEFGKFGYEINDKHATVEEVKASKNPVVQRQAMMIGKVVDVSNKKSVNELGLKYHTVEQTMVDMAYSMIKQGLISDKTQNK